MNDKHEPKWKNFPKDIPGGALELNYCGAYRNVDFSGYESPIRIFMQETESEINHEIDREVYRRTVKIGVDINKHELMRALESDRMQYAEGYKQGYRAGFEAAQSEWISVDDRLPDDVIDVLVFIRNGSVSHTCIAHMLKGRWWSKGIPIENVTHWMGIPDPPKEADQ